MSNLFSLEVRLQGEEAIRKLSRFWFIVGIVLLVASVAQPIVSSFLRDVPPEQLLSFDRMAPYMGVEELTTPPEVEQLFAGVFANIQFSLIFAAVKFALGLTTVLAVRAFRDRQSWGRGWLEAISWLGAAAFVSIGVFFIYSATVLIGAWSEVPFYYFIFPTLGGALVAALAAIPLARIALTLRSPSVVAKMRRTTAIA